MMQIPKKIKVGYNERLETYSKKLAYVIYYDTKGTLRKEASWRGWIDKSMGEDDFDNEPLSGFVLNKKVGGYRSGWNHRQTKTRVYDPRGFEIEISIENLLYILENENSIKGKGLEGEYVYAWNGTDLILLPTSSQDYADINSYADLLKNAKTFKSKDLVVGGIYLLKDNIKAVYLGRFDKHTWNWALSASKNVVGNTIRTYKQTKVNWFGVLSEGSWCYSIVDNIENDDVRIINRASPSFVIDKFDDESITKIELSRYLEHMQSSDEFAPIDNSKHEISDLPFDEFKENFDKCCTYSSSLKVYAIPLTTYEQPPTTVYIEFSKVNDRRHYDCDFASTVDSIRFFTVPMWSSNKRQQFHPSIAWDNSDGQLAKRIYDILKPKVIKFYSENRKNVSTYK